jgi:translation initiation factor IF-1
MSKQDHIEMSGTVTEESGRGFYRVLLVNGHTVIARLAGRVWNARVRVVPGDEVTVALSQYDLTKGRIIYRHTPGLRRGAA